MAELNYHHLRYFWAIAEERSLTRAARRLHVSQSAISRQIALLEEELGEVPDEAYAAPESCPVPTSLT